MRLGSITSGKSESFRKMLNHRRLGMTPQGALKNLVDEFRKVGTIANCEYSGCWSGPREERFQ